MSRKKGVPDPSGPSVFFDYGSGKGRRVPLMRGGKQVGWVKLNDVPPVKDLHDVYGGAPEPPKGAA